MFRLAGGIPHDRWHSVALRCISIKSFVFLLLLVKLYCNVSSAAVGCRMQTTVQTWRRSGMSAATFICDAMSSWSTSTGPTLTSPGGTRTTPNRCRSSALPPYQPRSSLPAARQPNDDEGRPVSPAMGRKATESTSVARGGIGRGRISPPRCNETSWRSRRRATNRPSSCVSKRTRAPRVSQ